MNFSSRRRWGLDASEATGRTSPVRVGCDRHSVGGRVARRAGRTWDGARVGTGRRAGTTRRRVGRRLGSRRSILHAGEAVGVRGGTLRADKLLWGKTFTDRKSVV